MVNFRQAKFRDKMSEFYVQFQHLTEAVDRLVEGQINTLQRLNLIEQNGPTRPSERRRSQNNEHNFASGSQDSNHVVPIRLARGLHDDDRASISRRGSLDSRAYGQQVEYVDNDQLQAEYVTLRDSLSRSRLPTRLRLAEAVAVGRRLADRREPRPVLARPCRVGRARARR